METKRLQSRVNLHDGIVGMIYLISVVLALTVSLEWIYLAGAVALLQISSMFTGFCPVYYGLDKFMPNKASNKRMKNNPA